MTCYEKHKKKIGRPKGSHTKFKKFEELAEKERKRYLE
jgi:hypothetical protein